MSGQDGARDARLAQVAVWAREVGRIEPDGAVHVVERACALSGWPPLEVVIAVELHGVLHERIVHKRLERVTRVDVAAAWRGGDTCCGP